MKRTIYFPLLLLVLATLALSTGGCDTLDPTDRLDKEPSGRLDTEDVFSERELVEGFLANTYKEGVPLYFNSYRFFSWKTQATDIASHSQYSRNAANKWNNGLQTPSYHPWRLNLFQGESGPTFWDQFYSGIRQANLFLENTKPASAYEGLDEEERAQMIAEARVLRAFFHAELLKNYGARDQGIPIADRSYPADYDFSQVTRASYDSTARWIARECDQAAQNLPPTRRSNEEVRAAASWAYAIKSRTLLYAASPLNNPEGDTEKWRRAADAAQQVLDIDGYQLDPDYGSIFKNAQDELEGIIWQHPRENSQWANYINAIPWVGGYRAGLLPTQELVDMYEMKDGTVPILGYEDADRTEPIINPESSYDPENPYENRDSRFYQSIYYNGAPYGETAGGEPRHIMEIYEGGVDEVMAPGSDRTHTTTGYYLKKWITPSWYRNETGEAYWPIFRLAEFYLNFAEAENEVNGPTPAVYDAVNAVRERAGQPDLPQGLSQSEMRQRIRRERTVELAFEEHRFYDVRRWNILEETNQHITGMRITRNDDGSFDHERFVVEERQAWQERFLVQPTPLEELQRLSSVEQHDFWQ